MRHHFKHALLGWVALAIGALLIVLGARAWHHPSIHRLTPVAREPADPPGTVAFRGSLARLRGGPYLLGFSSSGNARLTIGHREVFGRGLLMQRFVFEETTPVALRFAAPPGAKLLWTPPGRRGTAEYVPTSMLSPEPPDRAQFGADAGSSRLGGTLALLGIVMLLGGTLWMSRARLSRVRNVTWVAMGAVFALALVIRLIDLGGAGVTWDEDIYWSAGRNYVENLLSFDLHPGAWQWNAEHPPITKYVIGIAALLTENYWAARALSALELALACALLVPVGARLGSRIAGVFAGVVASLTPHLIAHGQIIGHEAPSLLLWVLGVGLALELHPKPDAAQADGLSPPVIPNRRFILQLIGVGVVVGLSAATRFIAALLGPMVLLVVTSTAPSGQRLRTFGMALLGLPLVSILVFWAVWPLLWDDPIQRLMSSWETLRTPHAFEPFGGTLTNSPPWTYFFKYLVATAPLGVLAGIFFYAIRLFRKRRERQTWADALIILGWCFIPLIVGLSPVRQDGVRYVLPSVMAMSLVAGLGFAELATLLQRWVLGRGRALTARWVHLIIGASVMGYLGWVCVRAHPYYLDYYGEHTGGASKVSQHYQFETAWWGEGLDRAIDYVNQHAAPGAKVNRSCVIPFHLTWFRGDLWIPMVDEPTDAEWILVYSPSVSSLTSGCEVPPDARRVFVLSFDGMVLAEVHYRVGTHGRKGDTGALRVIPERWGSAEWAGDGVARGSPLELVVTEVYALHEPRSSSMSFPHFCGHPSSL